MRSSHYHGLSWYIITHFIMSTLQYSQLLRDNSDGNLIGIGSLQGRLWLFLWTPSMCRTSKRFIFEARIVKLMILRMGSFYIMILHIIYIYIIYEIIKWDYRMFEQHWLSKCNQDDDRQCQLPPYVHPPNPVSRGCQLWQYQITTCARATNCFILQIYMEHGIGGGV